MEPTSLQRLRELMARREQDISLAEAALVIAQDEYPDLDVASYLRRLDAMADEVRRRLFRGAAAGDVILALNQYLFEEEGFSGNTLDYYDPRNSFLNDVLERKLGIPLTLSIVYLEVGIRVGLPLCGVSFPGHFLVKCVLSEGEKVLDPYAEGKTLDVAELRGYLRRVYHEEIPDSEILAELLEPADKKEILARLLRNLKGIYLNANNLARALSVVDQILVVTPDVPPDVRDRGLLYLKLECFRAALADFQRYLQLNPTAKDADEIRGHILYSQEFAARLN